MGTFISQYIVKLQIPIGRISVPPFQKQPLADVLQTEHEPIAMKALMILPTLMLQKTSFNSKSKGNTETLKRRLTLWKDGQIGKLLFEGKTIQERLYDDKHKIFYENRKAELFARYMEEGKVNKALKILERTNREGILPLTDETFEILQEKHPKASKAPSEILLNDQVQEVHPVVYDSIDSDMIKEAIKKTRGSAVPSGLDADGWRRILLSGNFGTSGEDLRKAIADYDEKVM